MPVETLRLSPFTPLAELTAHEQKFLAGMRPRVGVEGAQVREFLPFVAGHFVKQRAFHVHNFIVRKRKNEVFAPRVEQTEGQRVVIAGAKQRIGLKMFEPQSGCSPLRGSRCSYSAVPSNRPSANASFGKCAGTQSIITPSPRSCR